ncbi:MAG: DNA polymerase III subunit delta [Lachnospiraceae bacterium]
MKKQKGRPYMSTIEEDIKTGQLKHIYLLCGAEGYLRQYYRENLKRTLCRELDQMNIHSYKGKDVNVPEIIELAQTLPFFADRRVMILEDTELFGSRGEQLANYLAQIPETVYFIFDEENVDKRSRLYKACNSNGKVQECVMYTGAQLQKWILTLLSRSGKKISPEAYQLFVEKTGSDMNNMCQELKKLVCYVGDREAVLPEDVEAICTTRVSSKVFDLIEAVARQDQKQALAVYGDMLEMRESPVAILTLIARQFNMLLMTKELRAKGYHGDAMAAKLGVPAFVANKYLNQAGKFTVATIRQAIEDCVETDENFKSGRISDSLGVEMLIVKYSRKGA